MLFNSLHFIVFFPVVVMLYFRISHHRRWIVLLAASYYFYMSWRPEYLILILVSTVVDYVAAIRMAQSLTRRGRRTYLIVSLFLNLGLLFFFKYFNFVSGALQELLAFLSIRQSAPMLDVLLPVGISFYTFQTLSYTIDVYRGDREPERHLGIFALYVAFFPQLVAGPIERSTHLLPQFFEKHEFDRKRVVEGIELMLWGLFKKIVIADRLGLYVDPIYANPAAYQGAPLILATYFFAFQIYLDFSAYSDIAIGAARVMGYELMENFRYPYISQSIAEFWKRWHISLTTWFRDYLYVPLGGNRVARRYWYRNVLLVFLASGLWHGANWTFAVWGMLHGSYFLVSKWTADTREKLSELLGLNKVPLLRQGIRMLITFHLVLLGWVFFRAETLSDAILILRNSVMFDFSRLGINTLTAPAGRWAIPDVGRGELSLTILTIVFLVVVEFLQRRKFVRAFVPDAPTPYRWAAYYAIILGIMLFGSFSRTAFIYYQF